MGGDESHFNVSVGSDGQNHKTVSTNHNLFEEKGEPKRYRTEVLPLTSLTAMPNRLTLWRHQGNKVSKQAFFQQPLRPIRQLKGGYCGSRSAKLFSLEEAWLAPFNTVSPSLQ